MEKQIEKAEMLIKTPSKSKKLKFTKSEGETLELNQKLIDKTKMLLGLKGYYTNIKEEEISNETVIARYHELFRIEQAFRIAKSDLQTRPIFHRKEDPIKLHILICFMEMVVAKHIELQTGISIKRFITQMKKINDARMINEISNKEVRIRTEKTTEINEIIKKLNLPH